MLLLITTATLCCIPLCLLVSFSGKTRARLYRDAARRGDLELLRYFAYPGRKAGLKNEERLAALVIARQHNQLRVIDYLSKSDLY